MQKVKFTGIDESTHKDWEIIQQYDNPALFTGLRQKRRWRAVSLVESICS
jgi:hypothetical protein